MRVWEGTEESKEPVASRVAPEALHLRKVQRQIMGQYAVLYLGLGPRYGLMGLRQLLNVVDAHPQRIMKRLHCADLQHVEMTCASLGSFLSQLLRKASRVRQAQRSDLPHVKACV